MKLVIAIVQDDDSAELIDSVTEAGFRVTQISYYWGIFKSRKYNFNYWSWRRKGKPRYWVDRRYLQNTNKL